MEDIILLGAGGHCRSVIDVIEQQNRFSIKGIVDLPENLGTRVFDYNVIGTDDDLRQLSARYTYACITVGQTDSPKLRASLYRLAKDLGFFLPVIASPRAYVSKHSRIGEGTVVMHGALINANAHIGNNCIINTNALIEHDAVIHDNCHVSTGAIINGGVSVEKNCFIGSNAVTKQGVVIVESSFIRAGSVVK